MKEELLKNLTGIFDYIKQGADFIKEQAPLFIQEFITYKIWFYSFWVAMSIVISVVGVFVFRKFFKFYQNSDTYCEKDKYIFFMVITGGVILSMFITFCCCAEELMKVYFAPRYFLVDQLLSLGK